MTARVVVAEDQAIVRDGLVLLLGLLPGVEVVGAAADGEEALRLVAEHQPDIVLMDLRMPRLSGVAATKRVREEHPGTQVVVLTTYADDASVFSALRAGARGFLTKSAGADEIAAAIASVMDGHAGLDPRVQGRLLDSMTSGAVPAAPVAGPPSRREEAPDGLTRREREVLILIAAGRSNAEIAAELYVSEATVKTHINNLFAKAGLRTRAQAVAYAFRHGLVEEPGE
ncbi:DNA-binding response regulator [Actinorhabdospora filicis]|uniref:DNA-binding response regulator n=1 Tax=Actinorhabdospora filicis TaxID=1785913 RepID=A0A9W6ST44_9ACTN|nr:response regulator transcription factor [Actinorhabdospora filicis]GLZ81583.1 DNA-binding response regulator [Actinorhabdospora filicis]